MQQHVMIGLVRFGTLKLSDFNTANVLFLKDNKTLLSIDECGAGWARAYNANSPKPVLQYIARHRADIQSIIQMWVALSHRKERQILSAIARCGLPRGYVQESQKNLANLTPDG